MLWRWTRRLLVATVALLLGPLAVLAFGGLDLDTHWRDASLKSSGQAPLPSAYPPALVQVYAARAFNWRGAFAVHTWVATKRRDADHYRVYQVVGWNHYRGLPAVVVQDGAPDFKWFGAVPELLVEHRGDGAEDLIDRVERAVADYPWVDQYRVWPGPNSNSFTAYVARAVPELGVDLPPTAIGKDYLGVGLAPRHWLARTPSGSGWQISLAGLIGAGAAREEGVELQLLGLGFGLDFNDGALRLPGVGRVELFSG